MASCDAAGIELLAIVKPERLLRRLATGGLSNVRFEDFTRLVEKVGFELSRVSGSHHIFFQPRSREILSLQNARGEAKPYQIRQFLRGTGEIRPEDRGIMKDYHINIFFSEEDGGYIADIPDLESCSAFGSTPEEALAEVEKAKKGWIEAAQSAGIPIPRPRYRPAIYQSGPQVVRESGDSKTIP